MKTQINFFFKSLMLILIFSTAYSCGESCEETCENGFCELGTCECFTDWTGENCDTKVYSGGGNCNYTSYYGVQNCTDYGYVQVSSSSCCPSDYPYYNSNNGQCYRTCSAAYDSSPSGYISYGTGETSGSSSSGYDCSGTTCYYVSSNASYSSQSVCESYCGGTSSSGYNCYGSICTYVSSNASYSSQSVCESYCGSSGSTGVGEVSFYTMSDLGCGNITVTVSGYASKTISSYYSSGITTCNNSGCANYNLTPGTYTYTASCSGGYTWGPSTFTITDGGCLKYRLQ